MIRTNTPIEEYKFDGVPYLVKREDLACKSPGPPFAKVRGLFPVLQKLKADGITTVAYVDTAISMAGWGISYFTQKLGMKSMLYYPVYKDGFRHKQEQHLAIWKRFGATIIPLMRPQMLAINRNIAKKDLRLNYPGVYMLPNGLTFPETVEEVSKEVMSIRDLGVQTIVICTGSGAMTAGVIKGIMDYSIPIDTLISVRVHKQASMEVAKSKIVNFCGYKLAHGMIYPGIDDLIKNFVVLSGGYMYEECAKAEVPFPCNPYYDLKALEYIFNNIHSLKQPILFWNIGA